MDSWILRLPFKIQNLKSLAYYISANTAGSMNVVKEADASMSEENQTED